VRLVDLMILYLAVGVAAAIAVYRRSDRSRSARGTAFAMVPLWPLLAPIAWTPTGRNRDPRARLPSDAVSRIEIALDEGAASVIGTPLERLLNAESARTILDEVRRVSARRAELLELLSRDAFSLKGAEENLALLERGGATGRARASARLHLENVARLHELAERDARVLEELSGLATALRTQLVLVRMSGSSAEGVGDIVGELWSRIEGLREASDEALGASPEVQESPA
jgi:hypothetical protein